MWQASQLAVRLQSGLHWGPGAAMLRAWQAEHVEAERQETQLGIQAVQILPLVLFRTQKKPGSMVWQSEEHPSPLTVL